jgi:hypothetical protein
MFGPSLAKYVPQRPVAVHWIMPNWLVEGKLCRTPIFPGSFIDDLPWDVPDEKTTPNFSGE